MQLRVSNVLTWILHKELLKQLFYVHVLNKTPTSLCETAKSQRIEVLRVLF